MGQRGDQVFQLSLTEIAFTIAFILLLLLGYLVFKEQTERLAAERALAKVQSMESTTAAFEQARGALTVALEGAGATDPNEVVSKLTAAEDIRTERDRLKEEIADLNEKLTALTELQSRVEKAAASEQTKTTKEEVHAALALQEQLRQYVREEQSQGTSNAQVPPSAATAAASNPSPLPASAAPGHGEPTPSPSQRTLPPSERGRENRDALRHLVAVKRELQTQLATQLQRRVEPGREGPVIKEVVTAARTYAELAKSGISVEAVKKENSDLRGQVAFFKHRLEARGGRDYPPCWADEGGKVQFLFSVEMKSDSILVTPAWPQEREADARGLPGLADALSGSPHSHSGFVSRIQGIFNWSKAQDPQCRHYVLLKSSIADAVQSDRTRLMIENYFYKSEVRR